MPKIIGDMPCPNCRSNGRDRTGNHLMIFDNGDKYCNKCGYREGDNHVVKFTTDEDIDVKKMEEIEKLPFSGIRGILQDTAEKFGVRVEYSTTTGEPVAEYYPVTKGGKITGYKVRKLPKTFTSIGDTKDCDLFGQSTIEKSGRRLLITEGELDAMSAYQMLKAQFPNGEPNVVSLPNGANSKAIDINYDWLKNYREIVVCTDMDEKGQEVASQIVAAFADKVRVMKLPEKDANDCLVKGQAARFVEEFLNAKEFVPDGIKCGADVDFDSIFKSSAVGYSIPYPLLSAKMHGLRKGELTTLTAGSGIGKSTVAKEIAYHLLNTHKLRIGLICLEEPASKTLLSYIAMDLQVPVGRIREDHTSVNRESARQAFEKLVHNDRFWYLDHFASIKSDTLMEKMRYLAVVKKCDFIVLDHLSMVISGLATMDERKEIDMLMTKLAAFTNETGVGILNIVHLKRGSGTSFNDGGQISLNDLRGSAALEQLSWNVIAIERNQQDEDKKNISQIRILKCREWGYTGLADTCEYNIYTGRHYAVDLDEGDL